MKWIRVAIGAVIAVLTIGIIATTVYKMTQPSEVIREVSFEIDPARELYYPSSAYNEILEYGVTDENYDVINIVSVYVNNEITDLEHLIIYIEFNDFLESYIIGFSGDILIADDYIAFDSYIDAYDNWIADGSTLTDNVNIKLVFEVPQPPKLSGSSAILILLIPTVFAGSVLLYFYKPFKKD